MDKTIRIISIDPGINNTGYSFGLFNTQTDHLTIKDYGDIQANAMAKKEQKEDYKVYGTIISHAVYEREITNLIDTYHPDYVVCESAFFNPRMPNAYLSLSLCISIIKNVLYRRRMILYTIAPKEAKLAVASATADKAAIQERIHNLPNLTVKHTKVKTAEKMTEHSADSVAIMRAFCNGSLRNLLLSNTPE